MRESAGGEGCAAAAAVAAVAPPRPVPALVEVAEASAGRGLGLRALAAAERGAVLLEEAPLFHAPGGQRPAESVAAFERLGAPERAAVLELVGHPGPAAAEVGFSGEQLAFLRVLRTNGVAVPPRGSALYGVASRANHSCLPNASLNAQADGRIRLMALRPIAPGDEVLVSYIGEGELLRPTLRRQGLLRTWDFTCQCVRCQGMDDARGFRCSACGAGTCHPHPSEHRWSACSSCGAAPDSEALSAAEEEWARHLSALQGSARSRQAMAAAVYSGLTSGGQPGAPLPAPESHWIGAQIAAMAAEALLAGGDDAAAVRAARGRRRFARRVLGGALSRAGSEALAVEAEAAARAGETPRALGLLDEALAEAAPLPRVADGLAARLRERRGRLAGAAGAPAAAGAGGGGGAGAPAPAGAAWGSPALQVA